jgi:hypothetical protein
MKLDGLNVNILFKANDTNNLEVILVNLDFAAYFSTAA